MAAHSEHTPLGVREARGGRELQVVGGRCLGESVELGLVKTTESKCFHQVKQVNLGNVTDVGAHMSTETETVSLSVFK